MPADDQEVGEAQLLGLIVLMPEGVCREYRAYGVYGVYRVYRV